MEGLSKLVASGFRSLRHVDLDGFNGPTVLIGPNGAGKSNLLSFLRLVSFLNSGSLGRFVGEAGGAAALLHYGPKRTRELEFTLEFQRAAQDGPAAATNAYHARLGYAAGDRFVFLEEEVGFRPRTDGDFRWQSLGAGHFESRLSELSGDVTAKTTRWFLSRINFFHFHDTSVSSAIRSHSRPEDARYLRSDGSNLAAFLLALKESDGAEDRAAWQRVIGMIRKVAPFIKDLSPSLSATSGGLAAVFQPPGQASSRGGVRLDWVDDRDEVFGPHHLSDGTLRAIALITALGQPVSRLPLFISIDEPELGLHPAALALICGLVHSVTSRSQVILSTQSPELLDHFSAESVVVVERHDGASVFKRLEPERLAAWLDEYSLSELYDKNVLGGRP